jgi:RNA polymerase primary sigma factor
MKSLNPHVALEESINDITTIINYNKNKYLKIMNYQKSDSLNRYFKSIKDLHPLTKEEELELGKKVQEGCTRSINKLVEHNLRIVVTIANKNAHRGILVDDLIQQGNIGLFEAAKRYSPDAGVRFASFAGRRILKTMNELIDYCGRTVRIPVNQEYQRYLAIKNGEEVDNLNSVRLDDIVHDDSDRTVGDGLILSEGPSVERVFEHEEFKVVTTELLSNLKERDQEVMKLLFGIGYEDSIKPGVIAERLGLSPSTVSQIITKAKASILESNVDLY